MSNAKSDTKAAATAAIVAARRVLAALAAPLRVGGSGAPSAALPRLLALPAVLIAAALWLAPSAAAQPSEEPFEIVPGSFQIAPSTAQAGAHEDLTTSFDFAHNGAGQTYNDVRDTVVELPPGFIGNNTAVPTCPVSDLLSQHGANSECPPDSQVGTISLDLTYLEKSVPSTFPVYNMQVTSPGVAAELGFNAFIISQVLPVRVRPGDEGLTISSPDIENVGEAHDVSVTIWGVPASPVHDAQRGQICWPSPLTEPTSTCEGGGEEVSISEKPFLATPTACGPTVAHIKADSWEHAGVWSEAAAEIEPMVECERDPFHPSIEATPTTDSAETSSGLDFSLLVPQVGWEHPETLVSANLRDTTVALPEGISLNPSAGSGLGSCTEAQLAEETYDYVPGHGCPPESKVGSIEVQTPVLKEKGEGAIYIAKPFQNPFHSLLAIYIVVKVPSRGVLVKIAGHVEPDPVSGKLTTVVLDAPQVPFSKFELRFRQGATSPLITPPACGTYTATAALTPWSGAEPQHPSASFQITSGVNGGPCPTGGLPAFHPGLLAGSLNNAAGAYTPFYVRLSREDGEQEITHFSIKLPPGVTGKLAGVAKCSDAGIAQAKSREREGMAALEESDPSCPASSEVGRTIAEAGVGSVLAQAPGKVYLAGPYHGAPISVVAITAAHVGPFDLGTVVIREALRVDPETAEVFVDPVGSDPIPHIIDGVPTHLRDLRVYMDKPEFVLNPTSCEPTSTASTVLGSGLNFASEADDVPVTVTSPFQAAGCRGLGFKPRLKLRLRGATHRGGTPAFRAEVRLRGGDANVKSAQVTLPHSEFLDNAHIRTICTRVQFAAGAGNGANCPKGSIYGHARAWTPLLDKPLEGPVMLRSSNHKLPDLVAVLRGEEITIDLVGHISSGKGGRIRNTFEAVPDAPASRFVLTMKGGKKGLLQNSTNICAGRHRAVADFTGHNGKAHDFKPLVKARCGKAHHKRHKGHRHKGGGKGHGRHHKRGSRR